MVAEYFWLYLAKINEKVDNVMLWRDHIYFFCTKNHSKSKERDNNKVIDLN